MTESQVIDLSQLPSPTIIDELSFEQIFDEMRADLIERDPELEDTLSVESEPLVKLLQVAAYRELILRQRHNDRVRQLLLAYADDDSLDHIGVTYFFTERLLIDEGDPDALPPVPPTYESDDDYRRRLLLAPDRFSTAGAEAAYQYHALGAAGDVKDVKPSSPSATEVVVAVLSRQGDGTASPELLEAVETALSAELTRPLTDHVTVTSADVETYSARAVLTIRPGPDPEVVRKAAVESLAAWCERRHVLGDDILLDALRAALYVAGVEYVELLEPTADIPRDATQAAYCESIEVTVDG